MKKMRKIQVAATYELPMLEAIDDYIEEHDISFSEFSRRAVAYYLDHNQSVTNVSIQDSEQDSTPEPTVQPIDDTPKPDKPVNGDFNWGGLDID
jgi:hypothetical protein